MFTNTMATSQVSQWKFYTIVFLNAVFSEQVFHYVHVFWLTIEFILMLTSRDIDNT